MTRTKSLVAIYIGPALLAALTSIGLLLALIDDGAWDVIGSLCLSVSPVVAIYYWVRSYFGFSALFKIRDPGAG